MHTLLSRKYTFCCFEDCKLYNREASCKCTFALFTSVLCAGTWSERAQISLRYWSEDFRAKLKKTVFGHQSKNKGYWPLDHFASTKTKSNISWPWRKTAFERKQWVWLTRWHHYLMVCRQLTWIKPKPERAKESIRQTNHMAHNQFWPKLGTKMENLKNGMSHLL